jgi:hypothetical protein
MQDDWGVDFGGIYWQAVTGPGEAQREVRRHRFSANFASRFVRRLAFALLSR